MLARSLSVEVFGAYSFLYSLLMILAIPIISGVPVFIVREASKVIGNANASILPSLYFQNILFILIYTLCIYLILFFYSCVEGVSILDQYLTMFNLMLLVLPMLAIVLLQAAFLRAYKYNFLGAVSDGFLRHFFYFICVGAVVFSEGVDLKQIVFSFILALVLTAVISTITFQWKVWNEWHLPTSVSFKVNYKKTLLILTSIGGVQVLFANIETILIGLFLNAEEVGIYRVALQISILVSFSLMVINQFIQPILAKKIVSESFDELQSFVASSSILILILSVIPALLFLFFGEYLIVFLYSETYVESASILLILIVGQLINSAFGSVGTLLNMSGNESYALRGMLMALIVNIFLNILLIPIYGLYGAAFSVVVSTILWNVILRHFVVRLLNIESSGLLYVIKKGLK